ncbi:hypothetical protein BI037_gp04 [Morganella phage vB_MmoP_MP2]|uniref:Uncharacterized protein n=1 Tax=Morganella phage vB_MmoP_MP2 TaxID=1852627 RepID=A0A192YA33_9CAUD|nr:hypothetical protein BI037_gp04 [Morganella phage vB_MmoP_MP2]ANM46383.1 hypothetical protein MP2_gp04 [Morganella phage vB_MmoP_MP2]
MSNDKQTVTIYGVVVTEDDCYSYNGTTSSLLEPLYSSREDAEEALKKMAAGYYRYSQLNIEEYTLRT